MSNNDIDRVFIELKALSQKKGYLLFDDGRMVLPKGFVVYKVQSKMRLSLSLVQLQ